MRIVHCCLSNFYIDGFSYQENEIVAQNIRDGHEVTVIASTESFGVDMRLTYLRPDDYIGADRARVIRLPYSKFLPQVVMRKLRIHPGVYKLLTSLRPDVILFHGTCGWELNTVARYKRSNPSVKLYVDSHEDFHNSARTWSSKWLLHYCYYRIILRFNSKYVSKILCVNVSSIEFVNKFYNIDINKIEFFPLGGRVLNDAEYEEVRSKVRISYGYLSDDIVFVQSGKIDRSKKLIESLRVFASIDDSRLSFLIVGHLQEDIIQEVNDFIVNDSRIRFLGWKTTSELRGLLCAADIYVQPGTQSATLQMSLCCRCAVIIDENPSHFPYLKDNGWLVGVSHSLDEAFRSVVSSSDALKFMSNNSADVAVRLLDYKSLAARIYH